MYLGKLLDPNTRQLDENRLEYDPDDLTTHAVCVGMTGSGKTGLCIDLLEEAALAGLPAILIDPKGDITNLLLAFPELRPEDFRSWVNPDDARRAGLSLDDYAAKVASDWRGGLAAWGYGPEQIKRLKDSVEFVIYTPGSDAGHAVSILASLAAPDLPWQENQEALRERIGGICSALLGLVGLEADPLKSREHILLANIFEKAWRDGNPLDLAALIAHVQQPPFDKLGVFDVDTFFPEKDRFALAMALNNIVAAPAFQTWISGEPLNVAQLFQAAPAKPQFSIFYVAHLSEAERMFFITLLLEQIGTWLRGQSGTTSLKALLYFDEVYGYFPPHPYNPPSKVPLLRLLKQARAFGLGVVLVTQNPGDLDYKGLTNAGTWFIGKLQTDRDKARLLEGLETISSQSRTALNITSLDSLISSLSPRTFLLHNVHAPAPVVFQTRWAMSYLAGPL
ncbi:MAG: ATP-binding protein, partial [Chloroflexi bacterium]|nr:ATP-binding protein [Chloroflexota bacterium]